MPARKSGVPSVTESFYIIYINLYNFIYFIKARLPPATRLPDREGVMISQIPEIRLTPTRAPV